MSEGFESDERNFNKEYDVMRDNLEDKGEIYIDDDGRLRWSHSNDKLSGEENE